MTTGLVVFLLGLFGVPLALLWYGHRLRRRPAREQRAFWGALIGHIIAGTAALIVSMIPPEGWTAQDIFRGALGYWALLLGPLAGAIVGFATAQDMKGG